VRQLEDFFMLGWLKRRLIVWAEKVQGSEIARLLKENRRLREEIERETGRPIQLTPAQRKLLAEQGRGVDPEVLKKISFFDQEGCDSAEKC
jgi:hypothetical protein